MLLLQDFNGLPIAEAIRIFLQLFRLPGESQKIERIMESFSRIYFQNNPTDFYNSDTVFVLSYSIIMLNTDAHNPQVKKRMTREEFLRNNRGIDNGKDVSPILMGQIYERITNNEIKMKDDPLSSSNNAANSNTNNGSNKSNNNNNSNSNPSISSHSNRYSNNFRSSTNPNKNTHNSSNNIGNHSPNNANNVSSSSANEKRSSNRFQEFVKENLVSEHSPIYLSVCLTQIYVCVVFLCCFCLLYLILLSSFFSVLSLVQNASIFSQ
jgi:Sec7-like guanine-nucleotide exchange factor